MISLDARGHVTVPCFVSAVVVWTLALGRYRVRLGMESVRLVGTAAYSSKASCLVYFVLGCMVGGGQGRWKDPSGSGACEHRELVTYQAHKAGHHMNGRRQSPS